jgi:hypothetical protein
MTQRDFLFSVKMSNTQVIFGQKMKKARKACTGFRIKSFQRFGGEKGARPNRRGIAWESRRKKPAQKTLARIRIFAYESPLPPR